MKKGSVGAAYDDSYTKTNRTFPTKNTVLLVIIIVIQIGLLIYGFTYQPKPQDVIHQYNVTVSPRSDGSLDIDYHIIWEALDNSEALTWVEIGMPNNSFSVYAHTVSSNVSTFSRYTDEDYVSLRLDFHKAYYGGDVIDFSFRVNQKDMLCKNENGYFYEFVPGWFNAIKVEQYEFVWLDGNTTKHVQQGSLDCGEYSKMTIQYGMDDFNGCQTIKYSPFDDYGAYNELQDDKESVTVMCCLAAALLLISEIYIIDSYVSYNRGRGFLSGHGYHVHTYGRANPYYIRERNRHNARSGGFRGGGGGCACACACACAGGGRAGCSQKDTYDNRNKTI